MRPGPLMVSEPGSFAEHTILERKPQIIAKIIATNDYPAAIVGRLEAFRQEIATEQIAPLTEQADDVLAWNEAWRAREGSRWLELDWFFAEAYFYRRVLEIVRYFQPGPWLGVDPFEPQKMQALNEGLAPLARFYRTLPAHVSWETALSRWLGRSLWGNRVDLSNITVATPGDTAERDEGALLLIDDREAVRRALACGVRRLDWVADNSGLELLADLGTIDMLLSRDLVQQIYVHAKHQPYFVSDAMPRDVLTSIRTLQQADDPDLIELGQRLETHLAEGQLVLRDDPFWVSWKHYSDWPPELIRQLAGSGLIVFKGDANYRRLVEDRHWPTTTPMEQIAHYVPAPSVVLRTLKSEVVVGLAEGIQESLEAQDPDWMINGRRGIIQYIKNSIL